MLRQACSRHNLRIAALFIVSAALVEILFRILFWLTPNDTAWESAPMFNFESAFVRMPPAEPGKPRVIFAGSSLATYGYLPDVLMKHGFSAFTAAHQGMHGVELASHWKRYAALKPNIVVIPVNMVDLRIERPMLMNLPLEGPERPRSLQLLCEDLVSMYGVVDLGGPGLLGEFPECLSLRQKSQAAAGVSAAYRLRSLARPGWSAAWDFRFTRGRSYEHYTGMPAADRAGRAAVTHRGHVPALFYLRATEELLLRGLELEILAEQTRVSITTQGQTRSLDLKRGWRRIELAGAPGDVVEVQIADAVYSELFADTYAARLAQNTGGRHVRRNQNGSAFRERRREDDLYENLDDAAYRRSFSLRNLSFERPGYAYLRALYDSKKFWAGRPFDADLPAVRGLSLFVKNLRAAGVRVVVVNAPENPLTLELYAKGPYYSGYLDYLRDLGGADFMDESESLPAQMFYDYHHLTYGGAERNTERLARFLAQP